MQLSPDYGPVETAIEELKAALPLSPTDPGDWLEFEMLCVVKDHFSIDARIERARRYHRPVKHLTHYKNMVKLVELRA